MDYLVKQAKLMKIDMRFDTWNRRSLRKLGSFVTVAKELSKRKLVLV
jgi:hypothetical protein